MTKEELDKEIFRLESENDALETEVANLERDLDDTSELDDMTEQRDKLQLIIDNIEYALREDK